MKTFLCLNYGSSSLKYAFFEEEREALRGSFDAAQGLETALLHVRSLISSDPHALAHRVVHGMDHRSPMLIDQNSLPLLHHLAQINPLHNAIALQGILKSLELFSGSIHYAIFDTDFHRSIPPEARVYGIDYGLYEQGFKRYGFHGLSYSYLLRRSRELLKKEKPNLILMHLGQGCSICAVREGQSVDTSMGFSPLEGLLMVSRPGDTDPGLIMELLRMGNSPEDLRSMLYQRAGLRAIAGVGSFKELLQRMDEPRAKLAFEAFIHRLVKYVGAYWFVLGGEVDALVFSGGIGENSPEVRDVLCQRLSFLGVKLSREANLSGAEEISSADSSLKVFAIKTYEEREMVNLLRESL